MNQYEIELRDKFAQIALVHIMKDNSAHKFDLNINAMCHYTYAWADNLMAERQKHLDMAKMVKAQEDGYTTAQTKK